MLTCYGFVHAAQTPPLSLKLEEASAQLLPSATSTPLGNCLPIFATLPGDLLTPVLAYLRLTNGARAGESFLMESAVRGETSGRWSYVGASTLLWIHGYISVSLC